MNKRGKKVIAFSQIYLLLFGIFSFAFFIGGAQPVNANLDEIFAASKGLWDALVKTFSTNNAVKAASATETASSGTPPPSTPPAPGAETPYAGFFGIENFLVGNLVQGVVWSLTAAAAIQLVGGIAGFDDGVTNAATLAVVSGIMSGKVLWGLFGKAEAGGGILGQGLSASAATWIGVGIAVAVFVLTYKDTETQKITFECLPWEAPLGGEYCELCNDDDLPCSEYRCKSLGQACDIVNKGTEEESCVWVSPNDVTAPTITPWNEPLTEEHRYTNHDVLPPSLGAKIVREPNNCIQAFTPLKFGIQTNEPAQCKIDIVHSEGTGQEVFDNMNYYFEDNFYKYNHTEQLNLPSPESIQNTLNGTGLESPEIPVDGIYNFYIRCRDANGNFNVQEFVFQICVDPSPDTTPPVIIDTSIESGSFVAFEEDEIEVDFYINEPSECRWDIESKGYDEMINAMQCSKEIYEINAQETYTCTSTFVGIENRKENNFYVRCKDQPNKPDNERNVNTQSFEYILWGSQPLTIVDIGPNETIFGATNSVQVNLTAETSDGAEEGRAICYFSDTGEEGSYISMFNSDSYQHSQLLLLTEGNYEYYIRCIDAGGNSVEEKTMFVVEVDTEEPLVTRAYRADGLKIVTDEDAQCVYSLNSCNYEFDDGLSMIYSNPGIRNVHFAEWQSNLVYYIKCRDFYGNEPNPDQCSIIASASNVR